jgi:uncharacterized protein (TIGR04255 family)
MRADAERVLRATGKLQLIKGLQRLGLRYINQVELDRPWQSITTLNELVPDALGRRIRDRRFHYGLDYDLDRMSLAMGNVTSDGSEKLQLDLDCYREGPGLPDIYSEAVMEWLDSAHEHIYAVFTSSLTAEYLAEIT